MGLLNRLSKNLANLTADEEEVTLEEEPETSDPQNAHDAMKNIASNLNKISDYFDEHPDEEEEFEKKLKDI